jgi:hypothetical protein
MRTVALIRNLPQHVIPYAIALIERGQMMPGTTEMTVNV